jgi:hypothetical protein
MLKTMRRNQANTREEAMLRSGEMAARIHRLPCAREDFHPRIEFRLRFPP